MFHSRVAVGKKELKYNEVLADIPPSHWVRSLSRSEGSGIGETRYSGALPYLSFKQIKFLEIESLL